MTQGFVNVTGAQVRHAGLDPCAEHGATGRIQSGRSRLSGSSLVDIVALLIDGMPLHWLE
jgi:hypothetical protein